MESKRGTIACLRSHLHSAGSAADILDSTRTPPLVLLLALLLTHSRPVAPPFAPLLHPIIPSCPFATTSDPILAPAHDLFAPVDQCADVRLVVFALESFERDVAQEGDEVGRAPLTVIWPAVQRWSLGRGVWQGDVVEQVEEHSDEGRGFAMGEMGMQAGTVSELP